MSGDELKRYELFGWDYESVNPLSDREVAWYRVRAERTGGRLLGLACGTGRLVCRLAEAGFDAVGLDLSEAMLSLARANAAKLPGEIAKRVRFVRADMCDFDLRESFSLAFIADNSFRSVGARRRMLSCLRCIRRHLREGGELLVAERRLDLSRFTDGCRHVDWSEPVQHPTTGEMVRRQVDVRLSKDRRRIFSSFTYEITHADDSKTIEACPSWMPLLGPKEYIELFRKGGFRAAAYVGYTDTDDDGRTGIVSYVCRPISQGIGRSD
ncbi:MAG: class I SAM-dependent methyltransferase [Planctomycetota bacterium]|jgi:SAM-dependent methyltransferase